MATNSAALIIREVRENMQMFEDHPHYLAVRLYHFQDPDAVVNAMPELLLNESVALTVTMHFCLDEIARFNTFNLLQRVRDLRGDRVKLAQRKN